MKKCTVCGTPKDDDEFYYDTCTDTLQSKCKQCSIRFVVVSRQYKKLGKKLSTKEFRERKLYV